MIPSPPKALINIAVWAVLFFTTSALAQTTPVLHCLSTQPNGSVVLTWEPVTQSLGFSFYRILRNAGTIAGTVTNVNTGTFTDNTANANVYVNQYIIQAVYFQFTTYNSNIMFNMFLSTTNTATTNPGIANLSWNALPTLSSSGSYITYSTYNATSLQPFGTVGFTTTQTQNINDCNTTIQYQVRVTDALGCISQSNLVTGVFSKLGNVVGNPDLRCTSVQLNGNVQLSWLPPSGTGTDFNNYRIWRGTTLIDSVSSFALTSYTDATAFGNFQSYTYHVTSQSGCSGHESSNTPVTTLSTMFLAMASPSPNNCQLSWTPMPILATSFPFYQVYRDLQGNSSIIHNTTGLQYTDANVVGQGTAYYQISVPDNSGCTSYSNTSQGCTITALENIPTSDCAISVTYNTYTDSFILNAPCLTAATYSLEIYNSMGQLTASLQPSDKNDPRIFSVAGNKPARGLNLYVIKTREHNYSGKLVVQ